jgi:hypothetical protein
MHVVVFDPHVQLSDLEAISHEAAVGLLVPDAGPTTSYERAVAALERGSVRNSLLEDTPPGTPLIQVVPRSPPGPRILLSMPGHGPQPNDRRFPIAVYAPGYRGLLTSESTRIPGLVSIVDVAPTALGRDGALGSTPDDDPAATLISLDEQIREHRDAKTPFLIGCLAVIALAALFWRQAVLPVFAAVLLANLAIGISGWPHAWSFAAFAIAFARYRLVAQGFLLVGVLAAYMLAMGIDERWVALSPFGPTQNARFYGLSNLLATLLLVPALAGAAILGRRFGLWAFGAVAALALVTVGGSQFGADGGGVIVLLVGYAVLVLYDQGLTRRTLIAAGALAAVLVLALAAGESHVTDALDDGPVGLAEDLWRRLELSWLRATSGWGVGLLVFGGIAVLVVIALRERRPLLLAYLAALGVSLLVNDSPNDVVVAGLAGYLALSSAPEVVRPAAERARPAAPEPRARSAPAASR